MGKGEGHIHDDKPEVRAGSQKAVHQSEPVSEKGEKRTPKQRIESTSTIAQRLEKERRGTSLSRTDQKGTTTLPKKPKEKKLGKGIPKTFRHSKKEKRGKQERRKVQKKENSLKKEANRAGHSVRRGKDGGSAYNPGPQKKKMKRG